MKILLIGYGKINKLIYENARENIVGIIDEKTEIIDDVPDVIIDFSHPYFLDKTIELALKYNAKVIIGTTGYNELKMAQIKDLSVFIPILKSENFSTGISIIKNFLKDNKLTLDKYKKTIFETHSVTKKDAPSGTAISLANIIDTNNIISYRELNAVGQHLLVFENDDEKITIMHEALDRKLFIKKVLESTRWLLKQEPGLYTLEDVSIE
jgi:4-hydroxy-tetrahydrodipicolinate reductase